MSTTDHTPSCHGGGSRKKRPDYLLWGSLAVIVVFYLLHLAAPGAPAVPEPLSEFGHHVFDIMNTMAWGIAVAILMAGLLSQIPREFVTAALGRGGGLNGILRATLAGILLDVCSHGILVIGARLYERGATAGQLMAFLIASPWNSLSLTFILIALIGLKWTLAFIVFSMAIGVISGLAFERLVGRGVLPANPNKTEIPKDFRFFPEAGRRLKALEVNRGFLKALAKGGIVESRMVLRWIFFGVVLASAVRVALAPETFGAWFGPTLAGLGLTLAVATVLEICSEGSTPLAADFLTRAGAPGNSFTFLMAGVSTDYTEVMVLREATKSWKMALFLPLITLPQILLIGWLMNQAG